MRAKRCHPSQTDEGFLVLVQTEKEGEKLNHHYIYIFKAVREISLYI